MNSMNNPSEQIQQTNVEQAQRPTSEQVQRTNVEPIQRLTKDERETILSYNEADGYWTIYSAVQSHIRKFDKLNYPITDIDYYPDGEVAGKFYQVPKNSGILYPVTQTIDTYVYNALMNNNNVGMSAAAGFIQSVVGCVLVISANALIRRISREDALF